MRNEIGFFYLSIVLWNIRPRLRSIPAVTGVPGHLTELLERAVGGEKKKVLKRLAACERPPVSIGFSRD